MENQHYSLNIDDIFTKSTGHPMNWTNMMSSKEQVYARKTEYFIRKIKGPVYFEQPCTYTQIFMQYQNKNNLHYILLHDNLQHVMQVISSILTLALKLQKNPPSGLSSWTWQQLEDYLLYHPLKRGFESGWNHFASPRQNLSLRDAQPPFVFLVQMVLSHAG